MAADRDVATVTWQELHGETVSRLAGSSSESAVNDARWMIERVAGDRLEAVARQPATGRAVAHLDDMVSRRLAGEPLQYVLGRWGFRTLDLFVDPRVLIPRPETEMVAGLAIEEVGRRSGMVRAVDLGTGSGAIALALAAECPGRVEVWATDHSPAALEVARANAAGLGRRAVAVRLVEGSWFDAVPADLRGRIDIIVSNPPYIANDVELPPTVADWEPSDALRSGPDGLRDLRHIITGASDWLTSAGVLICEIDPGQVEEVLALARDARLGRAGVLDDLTGRPRALVARRG